MRATSKGSPTLQASTNQLSTCKKMSYPAKHCVPVSAEESTLQDGPADNGAEQPLAWCAGTGVGNHMPAPSGSKGASRTVVRFAQDLVQYKSKDGYDDVTPNSSSCLQPCSSEPASGSQVTHWSHPQADGLMAVRNSDLGQSLPQKLVLQEGACKPADAVLQQQQSMSNGGFTGITDATAGNQQQHVHQDIQAAAAGTQSHLQQQKQQSVQGTNSSSRCCCLQTGHHAGQGTSPTSAEEANQQTALTGHTKNCTHKLQVKGRNTDGTNSNRKNASIRDDVTIYKFNTRPVSSSTLGVTAIAAVPGAPSYLGPALAELDLGLVSQVLRRDRRGFSFGGKSVQAPRTVSPGPGTYHVEVSPSAACRSIAKTGARVPKARETEGTRART